MGLDPDVSTSFAGVDAALACQFPAVYHYLVLLETVSVHVRKALNWERYQAAVHAQKFWG